MRGASWEEVERFGLPVNQNLPQLDGDVKLNRTKREVEDRLLCLLAVAAAAYGLPRKQAIDWLKDEHLWDRLAETERRFLEASTNDSQAFKEQIAVANWDLSHVPVMMNGEPVYPG